MKSRTHKNGKNDRITPSRKVRESIIFIARAMPSHSVRGQTVELKTHHKEETNNSLVVNPCRLSKENKTLAPKIPTPLPSPLGTGMRNVPDMIGKLRSSTRCVC